MCILPQFKKKKKRGSCKPCLAQPKEIILRSWKNSTWRFPDDSWQWDPRPWGKDRRRWGGSEARCSGRLSGRCPVRVCGWHQGHRLDGLFSVEEVGKEFLCRWTVLQLIQKYPSSFLYSSYSQNSVFTSVLCHCYSWIWDFPRPLPYSAFPSVP